MKLINLEKVNLSEYNKISNCEVYILHVKVDDIRKRADDITSTLRNTSWIENLTSDLRLTYEARARRTINKIINNILVKVKDAVTEDFGEYLVSMTAKDALREYKKHQDIPLAELLGKKKSGNSGFDFHSISQNNIISFGEAKYSGYETPYTEALSQVCDFIDEEKDYADILHLRNFAPEESIKKLTYGEKAFAAAFSLNAKRTKQIFNNILKRSEHFDNLLAYKELYLIGVEV
ncbi:hypothetical protein J6A31_07800 [bacterium]|nr:hypothetical protein [bacterium]